ncbi:MAG: hypothetical protein LBR72_00710, partial [Oscillospiraceae bacterium]|nr:hypothetical protein [Oscillospiraceae bacterium]
MKRTTALALITVLLLALTPGTVPGVAAASDIEFISDANFAAALHELYQDQEITKDFVKTIKELNIGNKEISSLKGIEYFTGLTTLVCEGNELTELDVSKNTSLEGLYCGSNQLTKLILSNEPKLKNLGCQNNLLSSLDVSKQTALKVLDCSNNLLTMLDLSQNTGLTAVNCKANYLDNQEFLDINKGVIEKFGTDFFT